LTTAGTKDIVNSWTATLKDQPYGNGVYKVSASSPYWDNGKIDGPQWLLFSRLNVKDSNMGAHWAVDDFANGKFKTDLANPRFTLGDNYYGDWVTIQLPVAIYMTKGVLYGRDGFSERVPALFRVYGSNDGTTWKKIYDQTTPIGQSNYIAQFTVTSMEKFSYFGLVISQLSGSVNIENFMRWEIYGREVQLNVYCAGVVV
jgi:hypothetical protein